MSSEANVDAHLLSATAASELIRNGNLTIEQYAHALLRRIDQRNEDVQAWQFLDRDQVIQNAKALDAVPMSQRGPLHGIPIGVKDVIYTKGKLFILDWELQLLTGLKICPPNTIPAFIKGIFRRLTLRRLPSYARLAHCY